MLGSAMPRERTFTDQALAYVPTDDKEYLADLVAAGGARLSPSLFVSGHVDQNESRTYTLVTNVPRVNSAPQPEQHQQCEAAAAWSLCHQPSPG